MENSPPSSPPLNKRGKKRLREHFSEPPEPCHAAGGPSFKPFDLCQVLARQSPSGFPSLNPTSNTLGAETVIHKRLQEISKPCGNVCSEVKTQDLPVAKLCVSSTPESVPGPSGLLASEFQPPDVLFDLPQASSTPLPTLFSGESTPPANIEICGLKQTHFRGASLSQSAPNISNLEPVEPFAGLETNLAQFMPKSSQFEPTESLPEHCTAEVCTEDLQPSINYAPDKPLWEGHQPAPVTVQDCLVTSLTFAQAIRMSGQDFSKLLEYLDCLLPQPNMLPKTSHLFFKCFENDDTEVQIFYYCTVCWKQRKSLKDLCPDCKDPNKKVTYFLICPITSQLQKIFSTPGFREKIKYKHSRKKQCDSNVEDVYDGSVYKHAEETVLKDKEYDVTLQWYTDGISLFEVSTYSLWPFIFVINELPPSERYRPENIIIGGLWGCREKPHPNVFLLPIHHELEKASSGFSVKFDGSPEEFTAAAHLINGTCDSPARAAVMNMKGHAGYDSCPRCFIKGEKSARTGNVMVFPHEDVLEPRNEANYKQCVQQSLVEKEDYKGIYGPTVLSFMTKGDFIPSISIDSMHCAYMGCGKQLLRLWFDPHFSSEPFSLSQKVSTVNLRLFSIKLPHFVQRVPVGVDKLAYWKASLLRNFLLYMCLPVMQGLMKPEYYNNVSLLVEGLSLLNSSSISENDFIKSDQLMSDYCESFQKLYGLRHMSLNTHMLRHISKSVRETGNLFISSCFELEDFNGKVANLVHGTTHAPLQVFSRFSLLSKLHPLVSSVKSDRLRAFCLNLLSHSSRYVKPEEKISKGIYVVGGLDFNVKFETVIKEMLVFSENSVFQTFERLFKHGVLYTSASYNKGTRISCYCKYLSGIDTVHGKILTFVKTSNSMYYALISRCLVRSEFFKRYLEEFEGDCTTDLVPVESLINVCFCISIKNQNFVTDPLNMLELE